MSLKRDFSRIAPSHGVMIGALAVSGMIADISAAHAQITELMVTATRRAQSVQSIPYNISAFSGADLQQNGITDISRITRFVPGLASYDKGVRDGAANSTLIIRGINANPTATADLSALTVPSVSTYLGETPLFFSMQLYDIERVEVLRGPQGTLYGSGSLGGTLRFIPSRPNSEEFESRVDADLSTTEGGDGVNYSLKGLVNAPLSDRAAFRISAGYIENHGVIDAPNLYQTDASGVPVLADPGSPLTSGPVTFRKDDIDDSSIWFVRAALGVDLTDEIRVDVSYQRQEDEADGRLADSVRSPLGFGEKEAGIFLEEPYEREVDLAALDVSWDLGFATLSSSTSWYQNKASSVTDFTGFYLGSLGYYYGSIPRLFVPSSVETDESAIVEEVRLSSNGENFIDYVVGLYYMNQEFDFLETDPALGISDALGFPTDNRLFVLDRGFEFEDLALFGEVTFNFTDAWQVTGGFRAFKQEFTSTQTTLFPFCGEFCANDGVDPLGATIVPETTSEEEDVIFKVNTSYDLNEDNMIYFTWSEGFRRGGSNGVPTTGLFAEDPSFLSYDPDFVTNWEVGLKGTLAEWDYTIAGFFVEWEDLQIFTLAPNESGEVVINGGEAESKGVELELAGQLTEELSLTLGYSYTDSTLSEDFSVVSIVGLDGTQLPGTPEHIFTMTSDYTKPFANGLDFVAHVNGSYSSETTSAIDPSGSDFDTFDGFWLWDASVGVQSESWGLKLYAQNIADERGATSFRSVDEFGPFHSLEWFARPRTIGVSASYRF